MDPQYTQYTWSDNDISVQMYLAAVWPGQPLSIDNRYCSQWLMEEMISKPSRYFSEDQYICECYQLPERSIGKVGKVGKVRDVRGLPDRTYLPYSYRHDTCGVKGESRGRHAYLMH